MLCIWNQTSHPSVVPRHKVRELPVSRAKAHYEPCHDFSESFCAVSDTSCERNAICYRDIVVTVKPNLEASLLPPTLIFCFGIGTALW